MGTPKRSTYERRAKESPGVARAKEILAALPPSELDQLVEFALYLRATKPAELRSSNPHEELLYDTMGAAIKAANLSSPIPYLVFKKSQSYGALQSLLTELDGWLETTVGPMPRPVRIKAYSLFSALVVGTFVDIRGVNGWSTVPITMHTILRRSLSPGALFDQAFPGYAAAGFVGKILEMNRAAR